MSDVTQDPYQQITEKCLSILEKKSPDTAVEIAMELMDMESIPMHSPLHHYIVPAALLTAAAMDKAVPARTLSGWLSTAKVRAKTVPGGACGECGCCGSGVGAGIFASVYTHNMPKSRETWQMCLEMSGRCLLKIASCPGPRCCKRTGFLAMQEAVSFANEHMDLHLKTAGPVVCHYFGDNPDCLLEECPFHPSGTSL